MESFPVNKARPLRDCCPPRSLKRAVGHRQNDNRNVTSRHVRVKGEQNRWRIF